MNVGPILTMALPSLLVALLTVAAGWLVTHRLTYRWAIRQRRQESLLGATSQFYSAYGEFFTAWKLWNRLDKSDPSFVEKRWQILQKAASAEASTESIILKIVTELPLSSVEVEDLGRFRQGFQSLREAIREDKPLDWLHSEAPPYVAFKRLSCRVAAMLQTGRDKKARRSEKAVEKAVDNHSAATSNRWDKIWFQRDA
jgi:hypothetical protein